MIISSNKKYVKLFKAQIKSAKSVSRTDVFKNGKPVDIGIEIDLIDEQDQKSIVIIAGNFATSGGDQKVWGSAMKVKKLFYDLRVKWTALESDNSIPQDIINQMIGKEVWCLLYPTVKKDQHGEVQYHAYPRLVLTSRSEPKTNITATDYLRMEFDKDVAAGYVKDYVPSNIK